MSATAHPARPAVEAARAESVAAYLTYRNHVESCMRAYYGSACLNCRAYDDAASVADYRLQIVRERAAAGSGSNYA